MPSRKAAGPLWQQAQIDERLTKLERQFNAVAVVIDGLFELLVTVQDALQIPLSRFHRILSEKYSEKGKLAEDAVHRSRLGRAGPISHIPERQR